MEINNKVMIKIASGTMSHYLEEWMNNGYINEREIGIVAMTIIATGAYTFTNDELKSVTNFVANNYNDNDVNVIKEYIRKVML